MALRALPQRKTLNSSTDSYVYDDADKLTSITNGGVTVKSYGYDAAGRTHTVTTGAGTTTLDYDYEDRLTTITYPNSSTNTFSYNGLDTRVGKVDSAGTSTYKRDGTGVTAPVLTDGSAAFTPCISERRSSVSKFYGTDRIGTNALETDSSQSTSATRQYDAFGVLVGSTGSSASPFGFGGKAGYEEDLDSGLKLLGHRYYDSSTGRFLTRDAIKQGRNWYRYCSNNPQGAIDPDGFNPFLDLVQRASDAVMGQWDMIKKGAVNLRAWWAGEDSRDSNGHPVRIGGWPGLLNVKWNPLTVAGTVHVKDRETLKAYMQSQGWQDHEEGHIEQGKNGPPDAFLLCYGLGAIKGWIYEVVSGAPPSVHGPTGHDYNPLEIDADEYRDIKEGKLTNEG